MAVVVSTQTTIGNSPASGTPFPGVDNGQFITYLFFALAVTGAYAAGGDPMSFSGVTDLLKTGYGPLQCNVWSQSPAVGHSGFIYFYRPGVPSTPSNGKLQVLSTGAGNQQALAEIAAGAYPAGVTGDTIVGMAMFVRV